jgi:hypothetical protein
MADFDAPTCMAASSSQDRKIQSRAVIVELPASRRFRRPHMRVRQGYETSEPGHESVGIVLYRRNSGEISRGRISGISGQTMIAASTSNIGTSMIIVSFSA